MRPLVCLTKKVNVFLTVYLSVAQRQKRRAIVMFLDNFVDKTIYW